MGRPPLHSTDDILDAALELFAADGARGITMQAVAATAGVPSGSLYHRFPDRPALLAAMWLRTTARFHAGCREVLGEAPTPESAVAATAWTVEWCRSHLAEATALQAGVHAFEVGTWGDEARAELDRSQRAVATAYRAAIKSVADQAGRPRDEVSFAMLDLPLAVLRPHLQAGERPPAEGADLVRRLVGRLLES